MSSLTLQQKKAYFAKSRQSNYEASLRLEGFSVTPDSKPNNRNDSAMLRARKVDAR